MPHIGSSTLGESRIRLLRIVRRGDRHDPKDLTVSYRFEGDFASAFPDGRSDGILPGEALKNLTHRAAREHGTGEIEELGLSLCQRVMTAYPWVARARVEITEQGWARLDAGGRAQGQAFTAGSPERKSATITSNGRQVAVVSGIDDLSLMRTAGFAPPPRDETDDGKTDGLQRLLIGSVSVRWSYTSADVTFRSFRQGVRNAVIETFAWHASQSVQHTLYGIADVILASYQEIADITLSLHERPYRPADPFREDLENPDDLFVAAEEPLGVVEVTVERERK
jgi:urate oxidase